MKNKYIKKIIIGTWSLSGDFGFVSKKNIYKVFEKSINNNLFEFDTAPTYGRGKIHKILSEMFKNNKIIKINTKCGYSLGGVKTFNISDIVKSVDRSLKEFGKINTLFLHNPRNEIIDWTKILTILEGYKKKNILLILAFHLQEIFIFQKI